MNKKVVWDLFGGLNNSVKKSLDPDKYEIFTFDILAKDKDGNKNIKIDLTDKKDVLFRKLDTFKKPDIIVASPMCMSFSRASAVRGGSTGWVLKLDGTVEKRSLEDFYNKEINWMTHHGKGYYRYSPKASMINAIYGEIALNNTIDIIEKYNPENWYIENPSLSLMWNYIKYNLNKIYKYNFNLCHYGAYGNNTKKPTVFCSNLNLKLKKVEKGWRGNVKWEHVKQKDRSDIPQDLIRDIFNQFEKK